MLYGPSHLSPGKAFAPTCARRHHSADLGLAHLADVAVDGSLRETNRDAHDDAGDT